MAGDTAEGGAPASADLEPGHGGEWPLLSDQLAALSPDQIQGIVAIARSTLTGLSVLPDIVTWDAGSLRGAMVEMARQAGRNRYLIDCIITQTSPAEPACLICGRSDGSHDGWVCALCGHGAGNQQHSPGCAWAAVAHGLRCSS